MITIACAVIGGAAAGIVTAALLWPRRTRACVDQLRALRSGERAA